jgi:glycerophosphoryl diester phosphodiesterase
MWELDVGMSADGELVVIHDDTLERTSNAKQVFPHRAPWSVHTFTLAEMRCLDFGAWFNAADPFKQIAAGAVSPVEQQSYVGAPIPTLREALTFTRANTWRVNVEIKDLRNTPGDATVVEQVVALIEDLGMVDSVLVSSFNHSYLERVRAITGNIATGALVVFADPDPAALVRRLRAQAYNPRVTTIQPHEIAALREQGVDVYVWTVNDVETMRPLIEAKVSGIFTDFPQTLKAELERK